MEDITGASRLYREGLILFNKLEFANARILFQKSQELSEHPITALRLQHCYFAEGYFDQIGLPHIQSDLSDGWIRLGIFVCVLQPRPELEHWLSISEKVSRSARISAFLKACKEEGLLELDAYAATASLQEVRKVRAIIKGRHYWRLLNPALTEKLRTHRDFNEPI